MLVINLQKKQKKIKYGEAKERSIYGEATLDQRRRIN